MANRGGHGRRPTAGDRAPCVFPSDHGGFLGGEYGQTGEPDGVRREAPRDPGRLPGLAWSSLDADARVDHGARGQHDDRVEVHLRDLGVRLHHRAHPQEDVLQRGDVWGGPARAASHG